MTGTVIFELSIFMHVSDVVNNCIRVAVDISELVISIHVAQVPPDILKSLNIVNLLLFITKPLLVEIAKVILSNMISEFTKVIPF
jgi:hypothetical protein